MRKNIYLIAFFALLTITLKAQQAFVPGMTYYGANKFTEYHVGNSPLIFTAPHGGNISPDSIPDRTCNSPVLGADANTADLAMRIDSACMKVFGCHPHIIICNMSRKKVDCNRTRSEGTCGNTTAALAWDDFHRFADSACKAVTDQYGKGFYIDLHGHGHAIQRLEIGYLLHGSDLRLTDATLNSYADTIRFGLHNLLMKNKPSLTLSGLIRGSNAFGTLLAKKAYPSVPSQQDPYPQSGDPYFDGGYNTVRYSSAYSGTIDGLQIEHNYTGVRDSYHNRAVYADSLAKVLKDFLLTYYFSPATLAGCKMTTFSEEYMSNESSINIYPNPAQNSLNISFSEDVSLIEICNELGEVVLNRQVKSSSNLTLDISSLKNGLYYVKCTSQKGLILKKFAKIE